MTFEDFNLKEEFFNNFSYDEIKDSLTGSINRQYLLKYMSYLIDNNIHKIDFLSRVEFFGVNSFFSA